MASRYEIDCPRAKTWMTPCICRDGNLAVCDPPESVCVGCGAKPRELLDQLGERYEPASKHPNTRDPNTCADLLTRYVAAYVETKPISNDNQPRWNGEPVSAQRVRLLVADPRLHSQYWAAHLVGTVRAAVRIENGGERFYIDDKDGSGWAKLTSGGWAHHPHSSLYGTEVTG